MYQQTRIFPGDPLQDQGDDVARHAGRKVANSFLKTLGEDMEQLGS